MTRAAKTSGCNIQGGVTRTIGQRERDMSFLGKEEYLSEDTEIPSQNTRQYKRYEKRHTGPKRKKRGKA